ncbi:MAG: iron-sulfur cluster assembly scaffold protein [Gammaproteobacteria bacterium]
MQNETTEYSPTVWAHFRTPHNAGEFPAGTAGVFKGQAGARRYGRVVEFQLQVATDGQIAECRYRVYGCPATIALCSLTSEALKELSLAEATVFSIVALAEQLGLPAEKRAAAITVEDAIRAALAEYNRQQRPSATAGFEAKQA